MKLRLVVQTEGNNKGKVLNITLDQFVIGRDPQCHLRPASALISKRHCALVKRDNKAFLEDFDSTNGTVLNGQPVKGEVELTDGDVLKVGPLTFGVEISTAVSVGKPAPVPPGKAGARQPAGTGGKGPGSKAKRRTGPASDDEIAALLLDDDTDTGGAVSEDKVPDGSTVMDLEAIQSKEAATKDGEAESKDRGQVAKPDDKKNASGDTRSAANPS